MEELFSTLNAINFLAKEVTEADTINLSEIESITKDLKAISDRLFALHQQNVELVIEDILSAQ